MNNKDKQQMIDQVVKESNAAQRLTMYKAELINEIEKLKWVITQDDKENGWEEHYIGYNGALNSVLDIIKKKQ